MQPRDHYRPGLFSLGTKEMDLELIMMINSNLEKLKELEKTNIPGYRMLSISVRTIKKFIIASGISAGKKLIPDDLIEVVDYDPVRNSAITLGVSGQPTDVALHWFIFRAVPDVNAIARLEISLSGPQMDKMGITTLEKKLEVLRPDSIMDILPLFKDKNRLNIPGQGMLIYDRSFKDLVENIIGFLKESGKSIDDAKPKKADVEK